MILVSDFARSRDKYASAGLHVEVGYRNETFPSWILECRAKLMHSPAVPGIFPDAHAASAGIGKECEALRNAAAEQNGLRQ